MRNRHPLPWALAAAAQILPWAAPGESWTCWLAWVPWFIILKRPQRPPLWPSWLLGLAVSLVALRWMAHEFLVLYLATALVLSLHWPLFAWLVGRLGRLLPFPLLAPLAWTALEFLRWGFFPWVLAGQLLSGIPSLIQIADLTAIYGASFLVIAVNASLAGLWRLCSDKAHAARRAAIAGLLGAAVIVSGAWAYGRHRLGALATEPGPTVAVVQGNISIAELRRVPWQEILKKYRDLTVRACRDRQVDLVCWPESVVPRLLDRDTEASVAVSAVARDAGASLLLCGFRVAGDRRYRTAYLYSREGSLTGLYDKTRLVPFGEYVPGGARFALWTRLVHWLIGGNLILDAGEVNFPMLLQASGTGQTRRLGVLICYEDIFPDLSRRSALAGADFLVDLSNEAFFSPSQGRQREALARFRCVETRRGMVRAANGGISEIISPTGEVLAQAPVSVPGTGVGAVPLCAETTFHTRHGDLFGWTALGATMLLLALSFFTSRATA